MKKNYYAIIPANVRYSDLPPNAKLLYGEITALANERGYCWASNSYFSDLYGVSKRSITTWINSLIEKRFIHVEMIHKAGTKEIQERRLYIAPPIEENFYTPIEENFYTPRRKVREPLEEKFYTPIEENFQDNNTVFNNTSNITRDISNNVEQSPTTQIPYKEIVDYLNQKLGTQYRATSKKTRKLIKARFDDDFTLDDFKTVIDKKAYQWQGTQFSEFLRPDTLFSSKFEGYLNQQVRGYNNAGFNSTHGDYDSSGRQLL